MKLATLCYLKKDGKTLMLHRTKKENDLHEGKWNGVGGKFEKGETPEECAIREVKEETGLDIKDPKLMGRLLFPEFDKEGEDWHIYIFEIAQFSGELIESAEGDLAWIDDDKILRLNLWEGDKYFLEWMKKGKYFSGKISYKDGKVTGKSVIFHEF